MTQCNQTTAHPSRTSTPAQPRLQQHCEASQQRHDVPSKPFLWNSVDLQVDSRFVGGSCQGFFTKWFALALTTRTVGWTMARSTPASEYLAILRRSPNTIRCRPLPPYIVGAECSDFSPIIRSYHNCVWFGACDVATQIPAVYTIGFISINPTIRHIHTH